jgi:hypothetical protein
VWKQVKHDRVGRAGIHSAHDLKMKALAALHWLQKLPHIIRGFFADPEPALHHRIAVYLLTNSLVIGKPAICTTAIHCTLQPALPARNAAGRTTFAQGIS